MTSAAPAVPALEVACDESGSEGERLVGGNTDVFAHAGVRLDAGLAAEAVHEIRDRIRSPATEYKANHLLREKHRSVLVWLLGPGGPIHENAHVHLIEKRAYLVGRVADLLLGDQNSAGTLYRAGREVFGHRWHDFLESSNDVMRAKNRDDVAASVDTFLGVIDGLDLADPGRDGTRALVAHLRRCRSRADAFRSRFSHGPATMSVLDPLIPALVQTVAYWSADGASLSIVHDEQNSLTPERIAQLQELVDGPDATSRSESRRLVGLTLVDSRFDPRVQLADFLAGVARRIAEDELNDRGDAELTALLRPYVDASSIWGDDRSWSLLQGPTSTSPS